MFSRLRCSSGIVLTLILGSLSSAQTFILSDTNTTARVVADNPIGLDEWIISGLDHAVTNTYLWRVGDSGVADYLQNLTLTNTVQINSQFIDLTYVNAVLDFEVKVSYILVGGADTFNIAEVVRVTNTGNSPLAFRLFQYNDLNLRENPNNDILERLDSSTMEQSDGMIGLHYSMTGATPVPTFSQLGSPFAPSISGTAGYNLDTVAGNGIGQIDSGDVAFGFQWNRALSAGQSFTISTNKIATAPEPGTLAALGLGAIALVRLRKKR